MHRWFVVIALSACDEALPPADAEDQAPAPTALVERPAAPVVVEPPQAPIDSGPPMPAPLEALDGEPTHGVDDDPTFNARDLRDDALQRLLLRDPDRTIRALGRVAAPSTFHVGLLAQLARQRRIEGPPVQIKEAPMPSVPATGVTATAPGVGFVGVAELPLKKGKATAATLPMGTPVTIEAISEKNATVRVRLATRIDFGPSGAAPLAVASKTLTGVVPVEALVTEAPSVGALARQAANQPETDEGRDIALVLSQRAFVLSHSEAQRAAFLSAAWRARRPSWVAAAALEPVWASPHSMRTAWACRGTIAKAKWVALTGKLPEHACIIDVDVRASCAEATPAAVTKRRELLAALSLAEPSPVLEAVVDASRARQLYVVSVPIESTVECDEENEEHTIGLFGAVIRRLPLSLGTASTVISVPVKGWHGYEHSIVGAVSEAKARDWLRARSLARWRFDTTGEPSPSLGVGDTGLHLEGEVAASSIGRLPQHDCNVCGSRDVR